MAGVLTRASRQGRQVRAADRVRRDEVLETAAALFASSGFRTSVQDIAAACGIVPGGLYHHFDSKEAIVVELVERYRAELDAVAEQALLDLRAARSRPVAERIAALGRAVAECAVRHRAAVLLTLYEPPAGSSEKLVELAAMATRGAHGAMLEAVRAARSEGNLRAEIDVNLLADRICQSMLHVAVGVYHRTRGAERVPETKCRMLLDGVARQAPSAKELNASGAFRAAQMAIAAWSASSDGGPGDRASRVRAAARSEFARRGYEVTTIKEVAAAAGVSPAAVYRLVESKEELLNSIMRAYFGTVVTGWKAILRSESTPTEKLDAILWFDINVLDRYSEEHKIEMAWLRQSPPRTPSIGPSFAAHLRGVKVLLAEGIRAGELVADGPLDMQARCLYSLAWTPENIVRALGPRAALSFARNTVLRGSARRR